MIERDVDWLKNEKKNNLVLNKIFWKKNRENNLVIFSWFSLNKIFKKDMFTHWEFSEKFYVDI